MVTFTGAARPRSPLVIAHVAAQLVVETAAIAAILKVETDGSGYDRHHRPKALFEPHRFYRELRDRPELLNQAVEAGLAYPNWGEKSYPPDSYDRIVNACAIDETAAIAATSWGLPQILGSNCKLCGYPTPQAMLAAFLDSEDEQVEAMGRFLTGNGIVPALQAKNWDQVAAKYNGKAYRAGGYQSKLANAYAARPAAEKALPLPPLPEPRPIPVFGVVETAATMPAAPPAAADQLAVLPSVAAAPKVDLMSVERQLKALGYDRVVVDGKLDDATDEAILLFKARWNKAHPDAPLALGSEITPDVATALLSTPLPAARVEATAADLRAGGSIIAQSTTRLKQVGAVIVAGGATAGGLNGAADQIDGAKRIVSSAQDLLGAVPAWGWIGMVVAIGGLIFWDAGRALKSRVEMHRKGEVA